MKRNVSITKIMSANVFMVQVDQALNEVRKLMCSKNIQHIPIVEGRKLRGLISSTDLLNINPLLTGADEKPIDPSIDQQFKITDIMTTNLITINEQDTIRQACDQLSKGKFHCLPVIDDEGNVVGIVTSTDLVNYLNEQYESLSNFPITLHDFLKQKLGLTRG